jgi:hypothetical protein
MLSCIQFLSDDIATSYSLENQGVQIQFVQGK